MHHFGLQFPFNQLRRLSKLFFHFSGKVLDLRVWQRRAVFNEHFLKKWRKGQMKVNMNVFITCIQIVSFNVSASSKASNLTSIKLHSNAWKIPSNRYITDVSCLDRSFEFVQNRCHMITISFKDLIQRTQYQWKYM